MNKKEYAIDTLELAQWNVPTNPGEEGSMMTTATTTMINIALIKSNRSEKAGNSK